MAKGLSRDVIIKVVLHTAFIRSAGGTSLSDIAEELNVKKPSLYNHFFSREDIMESTLDFCGKYYSSITFAPPDLETVTQKYSADTVFRGVVDRYIKMHEKLPLIEVYTFVQSQKYFSKKASFIVQNELKKITVQTEQILQALIKNNKVHIDEKSVHTCAKWFCAGVSSILCDYVIAKKQLIMENPESGEGELFSLPADSSSLDAIEKLVSDFCAMFMN